MNIKEIVKLTALLFEDILVFLEKIHTESSNDEKRRYVLRPLIYIISKTKQMFTPVIPLSCINSFRSMHDKRSFHIVAIIDDQCKASKHSSSSKPIQTQMLFILIAKSGDERNKWTTYLQELTGKTMQNEKLQGSANIDLGSPTSSSQPSSTTSLVSLTSSSSSLQPTLRTNSVSASTLINRSSIDGERYSTPIEQVSSTNANAKNTIFTVENNEVKTESTCSSTLTETELRCKKQIFNCYFKLHKEFLAI